MATNIVGSPTCLHLEDIFLTTLVFQVVAKHFYDLVRCVAEEAMTAWALSLRWCSGCWLIVQLRWCFRVSVQLRWCIKVLLRLSWYIKVLVREKKV